MTERKLFKTTCPICKKELIGITEKQVNSYLSMHLRLVHPKNKKKGGKAKA